MSDTDPATRTEYKLAVLDADMTPSDIVDTRKRLNLRSGRRCTIKIDSGVRDYLVSAVSALRHK